MKKKIFTVFLISFSSLLIFAADAWKSVEEIEVNGNIVTKNIFVDDNTMRTENESENGKNETIINLEQDQITIINHKAQTFQEIKLSKYVEFAEQLAAEMKAKGHIDQEKVIPQVTFEKTGTAKVGEWECEEWLVKVDGKPYNKVWVAPSLKNLPIIKFKKRFSAIMPESLIKYRSIDAKIEDNFLTTGMIVKAQKIPANKKMPVVTQTVKLVEPANIELLKFKIPANYKQSSTAEQNKTEPTKTK
ncbi:MAG: DUF4412 domain-containing protein [bacterium]